MTLFGLFSSKPEWVPGSFRDGKRARRHRKTGVVQFVMWNAGEQGHAEDYWINADRYWWSTFVPAASDRSDR